MKTISRRRFLRGAGGIAIALPFLEAMLTRRSHAAQGGAPPRFIVMFSGNGIHRSRWTPVGTEENFQLDVPGDPGRSLAPLEPLKDRLLVFSGLDMKSDAHGPSVNPHDMGTGHMLTATGLVSGPSGTDEYGHMIDGSAGGPSIDQTIADTIGSDTAFRSLEFGVRAELDLRWQLSTRICYRGPFEVLHPENDPRVAFDTFFSQLGADPAELAQIRDRRRSVLDRVKEDFDSLRPRISHGDRARLEQHLELIRDIERSLNAEGGSLEGCSDPGRPADTNDYPTVGRQQMDLMTMALACDLTRVSSLQWSTGQSGIRFSWLGHGDSHHNLSHDDSGGAKQQINEIDRWYAEQFAYLLGRLSEQPELGGSLLDNTVVLWTNELGDGISHNRRSVPFVLGGNYAGKLRTGRWLQYDGRAHNDLYVSLLNLFGNDTTTFGVPDVNGGPLPNLG